MGFELLHKKWGRSDSKHLQNESISLTKSMTVFISEKVRDSLKINLEKFFLVYVDKKSGKIGIKFTKDNDASTSRKVTIQKGSTTACVSVYCALKELGIAKIDMKEIFTPLVIDGLIILDVKHLIKKSEG
jgi:hypothetical protein